MGRASQSYPDECARSVNHAWLAVNRWMGWLAVLAWGAAGWMPAAAAPGDWTTWIDGTVYHQSIGADPGADRLKLDPLAADDQTLWAGSSGGLTGIGPTGETVARLFRNDGLPEQDVAAVAVDAQQNVWIGTRSRGVTVRFAGGEFLSRALDRFDLGSDSVRVLVAAEDAVWVGTAAGVAKLAIPDPEDPPDQAVVEVVNVASLLDPSPYVNAIAARGDTAWLGTRRGIVRHQPTGNSLLNDGLSGEAIEVWAMRFWQGALWAGTSAGFYRLQGDSWVEMNTGVDPSRQPSALVEFEGELYAATRGGDSVYRWQSTGETWVAAASGFQGRLVSGLEVFDGRLFAATDRGVFERATSGTWSQLASVDPPVAHASFGNDFDYVDVVPTTGGVLALTRSFLSTWDGEGWRALRRGSGGLTGSALSRLVVSGDRLWIGHCCCSAVMDCPVDGFDDPFGGGTGTFAIHNVLTTATAPNGDVWFGSVIATGVDGQGLFRLTPATGEVVRFTPNGEAGSVTVSGLNSSSIAALAFDSRGRLWIGHQFNTLNVWEVPGNPSSLVRSISTLAGLPSAQINAIAAIESSAWVATAGGLALVNADGLVARALFTEEGLPARVVTDVAVDGCNRVWAATPEGVAVFDPQGSLVARFDAESVPGPAAARVNSVAVDPNGAAVWMGTAIGVSRFEYPPDCGGLGGPSAGGDGGTVARCQAYCPYPNPVRAGDRQVFLQGAAQPARVTVLDAAGRPVWRSSGLVQPGEAAWTLRDASGTPVPSGTYLLTVETGATVRVVRPVVVQR